MKFYIAATLDYRNEAREIMDTIEKRGHTVSLDWTKDSRLEKPYSKAAGEAKFRAERDIQAVMESDVFVLLSSHEVAHKGIYVEIGAAIASSILTNKPKIFVIGKHRDYGMFYFHSKVARVDTIEDVFIALER